MGTTIMSSSDEDPAVSFSPASEKKGAHKKQRRDSRTKLRARRVDSRMRQSEPIVRTTTITRRQRIINELLDTEQTYVHLLQILNDEFYKPLMKAIDEGNPIISLVDIKTIFQNLKNILDINTKLLSEMTQRTQTSSFDYDNSEFTDIFINLFDSTPLQHEYQLYINNYDCSRECLTEVSKEPKVQEFMQEALKRNVNFPNIQSYLITPIQRLPRYILILKDLKKFTD